VSTIEFSLVEVSVLHGLKQGNEVLKEIHREMSIESVEKLMDETQEAREYQRVCHIFIFHAACAELRMAVQEIGDLLANRLTHDEEDAVQAELLALQGETVSTSCRTLFYSFSHVI
jgi:charged multivesicular body protein 6